MDEFSELEADLKKLRPAAISDALVSRLEREMTRERESGRRTAGVLPRRRPVFVRWCPVGAGIAAALAFFLLARQTPNETKAPETSSPVATALQDALVPTDHTRVVYDSRDEGLLFAGDAPFRRTRYQTRETMEWKNPASGASLRVSYPSEETIYRRVFGE